MKTHSLLEACSSGSLHPEDWCDQLIDMVSDPNVSNQELFIATRLASRGCIAHDRTAWMDNLLEFSLWETGHISSRLDLCDYLVREGHALFDSPQRWNHYGGLLHVACEAASLDGICWALNHNPGAAKRSGGRLRIGVYHALCFNENTNTALAAIDILNTAGADASHCSRDGRNALFRCTDSLISSRLIELGADPWSLDQDGYNPVGAWLETGYTECAIPAFKIRPHSINDFIPWGSINLGVRRLETPLMDRPLFIATTAPCLQGQQSILQNFRSNALNLLTELGANPLLLDANGLTLFERSKCPASFSHMEKSRLNDALLSDKASSVASSNHRL